MWQYSTRTKQQLPPQLFQQMGYCRREVFIGQLGWGLTTVNEMELDEFDGPVAGYVCSRDEEGHVNSVASLLPTTTPHLMEKVFPEGGVGCRMTPEYGSCLDSRQPRRVQAIR